MSSINFFLRDEKKALRKTIKDRLADIPIEEVEDQCAKALELLLQSSAMLTRTSQQNHSRGSEAASLLGSKADQCLSLHACERSVNA
jgi:hypothetical protein